MNPLTHHTRSLLLAGVVGIAATAASLLAQAPPAAPQGPAAPGAGPGRGAVPAQGRGAVQPPDAPGSDFLKRPPVVPL